MGAARSRDALTEDLAEAFAVMHLLPVSAWPTGVGELRQLLGYELRCPQWNLPEA